MSIPSRFRGFLFCTESKPDPTTIQALPNRYQGAIFPGVKCPERETDLTSLSSVELKDSCRKLEVCHTRCVCENWKGYVVKHNYVN